MNDIFSYALLESAIRPDIQAKSYRSHEAGPSGIQIAGRIALSNRA